MPSHSGAIRCRRSSPEFPGSHINDGGFQQTGIAIAVPKGHPEALAYVTKFIEDAKAPAVSGVQWTGPEWRTWLLRRRSVSDCPATFRRTTGPRRRSLADACVANLRRCQHVGADRPSASRFVNDR